jgi:mono/diheme cytochrome c family protein
MKRSSLVVISLTLLALAVAGALSARTADAPVATAPASGTATPDSGDAQLARGKYMVTVSACHDCHTPFKMGATGPEPDMTRMLSGHPESLQISAPPAPLTAPWVMSGAHTNTAWAGPWGVSFTANLTPDKETGIGDWNVQTFKETIRSGRHMGRGRQILPPMPWPMYRNMTDQDLEAIFAYLRTIPAIRNKVPEPLPPQGASNGSSGDRDKIVAAARCTRAAAGNEPVRWPVAVPGDVS